MFIKLSVSFSGWIDDIQEEIDVYSVQISLNWHAEISCHHQCVLNVVKMLNVENCSDVEFSS